MVKEKKKSIFIKILVPALIVIAIGLIWVVKNSRSPIDETPKIVDGADFSLNIMEEVNYSELEEYNIPVIVDYGSDSCIPCQQMVPVLKTLNEEMTGKAFIKFVDVWKYTNAADNVPIQVIPTQVIFNADGTPFVPSDELANDIEFSMYSDKTSGDHIFTTHQGGLNEKQMRSILKEMGVE